MKFAFAAALLAVATNAAEVEAESIGYGSSYGGYGGYGHAARRVISSTVVAAPVVTSVSYATHYNGCGHHTDSYSDSCSSYSSHDYSSSDYGYGYRHHGGRSRYYRYRPRYNSGRYYYGSRYASSYGSYYAGYRSYPVRSYRSTAGYAW